MMRVAALKLRILARWAAAVIIVLLIAGVGMIGFTLWSASSTILNPPGPGDVGSLDGCRELTREMWGDDCGRLTEFAPERRVDFEIQSPNGYVLAGWIVRRADAPAAAVILYVPGGGSDRREASRYLPLADKLGLDLAVFDPVCQGLSPCPVPGLSYGARESMDVAAAVATLDRIYGEVVVMGSSMGALSIIRALPQLRNVQGVVLENPMLGLEPLLRDAQQSKGMPPFAVSLLANLVTWRGKFPSVPQAEEVMRAYDGPPLLFIHSQSDQVVPFAHSEVLAEAAGRTASTWFPMRGDHGAVWNANRDEFEQRVRDFLASTLN
ncbi:alpha/beta fold hydrolase [Sphingomonas sp. QA11]|uniref:alpha/beta hydrolase n=1 Tax=Sphingomonas sp. QA11 TaxID=2950605 RepID=UPI00234A373B|nr:alpha/beta fold hydrolase [Sphingomonas sp. QA11]WCM27387.1 alpha/beta fold hydrolase [Sphingomonas sp. QA11]